MLDLLIKEVKLLFKNEPGKHEICNVGVRNGVFTSFTEQAEAPALEVIEGKGLLLLPGLVEPHVHIDKTYSLPENYQPAYEDGEALRQAIDAMQEIKLKRSIDQVKDAARKAFNRAVSQGVCLLRSHLDLSTQNDLDIIQAMLEVREEFSDKLTIQFTVLASLETEQEIALVKQALASGVDCIGGAPALKDKPLKAIDKVFEIAQEFNCPIDLHIDETENPDSPCLEYLADQIIKRQWQSLGKGEDKDKRKVMASHCCSLAFMTETNRRRVLSKVEQAGIHLVTLPACNLVLMGRNFQQQKPRGNLPVKPALETGINVCAGADNVNDPFQPWGDYDPLKTASITAHVSQIDNPVTALSLVTDRAALALGAENYGLQTGKEASFSLVPDSSLQILIATSPLRSHIIYKGKVVLEQRLEQRFIKRQEQHWITS